MNSCGKLVHKLGARLVQVECLYSLCTDAGLSGRFFVRRLSTDTPGFSTVYASRFWKNRSVGLSCAHYTQALCLQINIESY